MEFYAVLVTDDASGLRRVVTGSPESIALLRSSQQFLALLNQFDEKMMAAYGRTVLPPDKEIRKRLGLQPEQLMVIPAEKIRVCPVIFEDDCAYVILPEDSVRLLRRDGAWVVDADAIFAGHREAATKLAGAGEKIVTAIRRQLPRIGQKGVTAEMIDNEVSLAALRSLGVDTSLLEQSQRELEQSHGDLEALKRERARVLAPEGEPKVEGGPTHNRSGEPPLESTKP